jgi:hypothetical protein
MSAKRVQEWVTYHGFATPVDGVLTKKDFIRLTA